METLSLCDLGDTVFFQMKGNRFVDNVQVLFLISSKLYDCG